MLTVNDFPAFFTELHSYPPFQWQIRLAREVVENKRWPDAISLPTGFGKTAALEIAVFAHAVDPSLPRRIVFAVDRRLIVDHAYDTATRLQQALASPTRHGPTVARVAEELASRGAESPLAVARLRGGMYREPAWIRNPAQPMVVCSTVDQTGSRLLHRGYGVSQRMHSVHAGLLAFDTLIILDEAHISEPFRRTITSVRSFQSVREDSLPQPVSLVTMSATLHHRPSGWCFSLGSNDTEDPLLAKRRTAAKPVTITKASQSNMANKIALEATRSANPDATVLVVVNRVRLTRQVADLIRARDEDADIVVITGQSRPIERDRTIEKYRDRIFAGRKRSTGTERPPLYIVATQAVEVGADIDADALITEMCPLAPLLQRAARIDRLGLRGSSPVTIVGDTAFNRDNAERHPDPLYGLSLLYTWRFIKELNETGQVDLGNAGWEAIKRKTPAETLDQLRSTQPTAPVMTPVHCDLWVQTSPRPDTDPQIAMFLHGVGSHEDELNVVWRADLVPHKPETWLETIETLPPISGEALSTRRSNVRRWHTAVSSARLLPILVWRGASDSFLTTTVNDLRPGDTLIVPTDYGGCDASGLVADDRIQHTPTADIADLAIEYSGRKAVVRVHPSLPSIWQAFPDLHHAHNGQEHIDIDTMLLRSLRAVSDSDKLVNPIIGMIADDPSPAMRPHPSGTGWIILGTRHTGSQVPFASEEGDEIRTVHPVTLEEHHKNVAVTVCRFARDVGIPEAVRDDLVTAAACHDIGKADPREQTVYRGDHIRSLQGPHLAKSLVWYGTAHALRTARTDAGLPHGFRHELISTHLLDTSPAVDHHVHDRDLVLHLVASHHGFCRPYPTVVTDEQPESLEISCQWGVVHGSSDLLHEGVPIHHLDRDVDGRFWRLVRRYGWWGLSFLEALLRLADHRVSETEQSGERR